MQRPPESPGGFRPSSRAPPPPLQVPAAYSFLGPFLAEASDCPAVPARLGFSSASAVPQSPGVPRGPALVAGLAVVSRVSPRDLLNASLPGAHALRGQRTPLLSVFILKHLSPAPYTPPGVGGGSFCLHPSGGDRSQDSDGHHLLITHREPGRPFTCTVPLAFTGSRWAW